MTRIARKMLPYLSRIDRLTRDPRRSRIRTVTDMRTGEVYRVRTCIEVRNVRTGRVSALHPLELPR